MEARHISAFLESTIAVFSTMLKMPVDFENPSVSTTRQHHDVSGVIGLTGDVVGSVVIGFGKSTAAQVASALAGKQLEFDSPDFADAIGEVANMIVGGAKARFQGMNVSISCPSVVVSPNHDVRSPSSAASVCIPCKTPAGGFTIDISIQTAAAENRLSGSASKQEPAKAAA